MYTLNITTKVNHTIIGEWIPWHKNSYLPELMATKCFFDYNFFHLIEHDDTEGKTFVTQLHFPSLEKYNEFIEVYDKSFRKKAIDKWGDLFISFRTILKSI